MFIGFTTKKKIAAATVTNAISAFRKSPYRNTLPLIVNVRLLKSGFPKIAAMIGVMMSATNAWTTPEDPHRLGVRLIEGCLAGAKTTVFQTSANRSGAPAPRGFDEINEAVLNATDVAIDGGELIGAPSTVVDLSELDSGGRWAVLREGALPSGVIDRILRGTGA